jgi:hypothetical protein
MLVWCIDAKYRLKALVIPGVPLATEPGSEDIAMKFEQGYVRCVRNEEECVCSAPNCCDTEQRSKYDGFGSEWDILYYEITIVYAVRR